MKKFALLNLLVLALPLSLQAKTLTPATTLKIQGPDGLTNVKDLTVTLNVHCRYKSGILFPESKTCGNKDLNLSVSNDGVVTIPETETFKGLHAMKVDNYDITLSVYEGKQYLAILGVRGKEAIKNFAENKRPLNILRFKAATLGVTHQGQDFFGSELAQKENAYALFSVSSSVSNGTLETIIVTSSLNHHLQGLENRNIYRGKIALKDVKELSVPETALAYLGDEKDVKLNVGFTYSVTENYVQKKVFEAKTVVDAKYGALAEIGSIELK